MGSRFALPSSPNIHAADLQAFFKEEKLVRSRSREPDLILIVILSCKTS